MPRKRSGQSIEAERRYKEGEKLIDIARDMGVPEGTVRRWKSDQDWDGKKGRRSETRTSMQKSKTNLKAPGSTGGSGAPAGNQNAVGNRGGPGAPIRNKHALRSGEYETIFFTANIMDDKERALLDADYDKYLQQYLLIDTLTIREKRILQRIRAVETASIQTGMVPDSATVTKGDEKTSYINRDTEGVERPGTNVSTKRNHSSVVSRSATKRIAELEDALTRVQARKQAAIAQLHRMEMDDARLALDAERLIFLKQRISGRIDLDELFAGDDLEHDLFGNDDFDINL